MTVKTQEQDSSQISSIKIQIEFLEKRIAELERIVFEGKRYAPSAPRYDEVFFEGTAWLDENG